MILKAVMNLKMKKKLVYLLFLVGFIGVAQINPVSIATDTTTIRIGEQIQFKIAVTGKNNIIFPNLELDSLGKVELVEALPIDTLKDRLEKKYLLTSFDSGQYVIPRQQVLINNAKYFTDSLLIKVTTVQVDTLKQKMFEIKSIKSEPKTFDDYKHLMWWILLILAVIGVILYFIFRKKKEKEVEKIIIAPIREAFLRLKELDEKQLLQQNKVKIYYSELTDIVRTYIEKDIKIPALESTTNELIETIIDFNESSNLGISKDTIKQLKDVLQNADLVKFAKSNPFIEEIKGDRNRVELILKDTQSAVHRNDVAEVDNGLENVEVISKFPVKKKKNILTYVLIAIAALVLILSTIGYFGYRFLKNEVIGNTSSEMMSKQWYTASYGYPEITLESPEILKIESDQLPNNGMSVIGDFASYSYGSLISNFYVGVSSIHFIKELEGFDLDKGVEGSLSEMETMIGTKFTNKRLHEIYLNNVEGRRVEVDYKLENQLTKKNEDNKLTLLFFGDTKGMRRVLVSHLAKDASAKDVSDRIIKSVSIKP